jgi:DNA-binding response OmpR family regulator
MRDTNICASLPILALSAESKDNAKAKVLEAGIQDFIPKPINKSTD